MTIPDSSTMHEIGSSTLYDYMNIVPNGYQSSMQWILDKKSAVYSFGAALPKHYDSFINSEFASSLRDIGFTTKTFADLSSVCGGYYLSKGKFIPAGISVFTAYAAAESVDGLTRVNGITLASFTAFMAAKALNSRFNTPEKKSSEQNPPDETESKAKKRDSHSRSSAQSPRKTETRGQPEKKLKEDPDLEFSTKKTKTPASSPKKTSTAGTKSPASRKLDFDNDSADQVGNEDEEETSKSSKKKGELTGSSKLKGKDPKVIKISGSRGTSSEQSSSPHSSSGTSGSDSQGED